MNFRRIGGFSARGLGRGVGWGRRWVKSRSTRTGFSTTAGRPYHRAHTTRAAHTRKDSTHTHHTHVSHIRKRWTSRAYRMDVAHGRHIQHGHRTRARTRAPTVRTHTASTHTASTHSTRSVRARRMRPRVRARAQCTMHNAQAHTGPRPHPLVTNRFARAPLACVPAPPSKAPPEHNPSEGGGGGGNEGGKQ
jgi:hypothetical protein